MLNLFIMMSISKLPYLYYPLGYRLIPLFTERLRLDITFWLVTKDSLTWSGGDSEREKKEREELS